MDLGIYVYNCNILDITRYLHACIYVYISVNVEYIITYLHLDHWQPAVDFRPFSGFRAGLQASTLRRRLATPVVEPGWRPAMGQYLTWWGWKHVVCTFFHQPLQNFVHKHRHKSVCAFGIMLRCYCSPVMTHGWISITPLPHDNSKQLYTYNCFAWSSCVRTPSPCGCFWTLSDISYWENSADCSTEPCRWSVRKKVCILYLYTIVAVCCRPWAYVHIGWGQAHLGQPASATISFV